MSDRPNGDRMKSNSTDAVLAYAPKYFASPAL